MWFTFELAIPCYKKDSIKPLDGGRGLLHPAGCRRLVTLCWAHWTAHGPFYCISGLICGAPNCHVTSVCSALPREYFWHFSSSIFRISESERSWFQEHAYSPECICDCHGCQEKQVINRKTPSLTVPLFFCVGTNVGCYFTYCSCVSHISILNSPQMKTPPSAQGGNVHIDAH